MHNLERLVVRIADFLGLRGFSRISSAVVCFILYTVYLLFVSHDAQPRKVVLQRTLSPLQNLERLCYKEAKIKRRRLQNQKNYSTKQSASIRVIRENP